MTPIHDSPLLPSFTIGTRGSDLALYQANFVRDALISSGLMRSDQVHLRIITTQGDVSLKEKLAGPLEKGLFTQELEQALREGSIDAAVHSLKDLPTHSDAPLTLAAILERHAPSDILLVQRAAYRPSNGTRLPCFPGSAIGTSSVRREALLQVYGDGITPRPLRGNVPTRVRKLAVGDYSAIVLARAGFERLKLASPPDCLCFELNPSIWLPAPGQGAIAVQMVATHPLLPSVRSLLHHARTAHHVNWERAFLSAFEGGCTTPLGAYAQAGEITLGLWHAGHWRAMRVALPEDAHTAHSALIDSTLAQLTAEPYTQGVLNESWLFHAI